MKRRFKVTFEGKSYEVDVEEVKEGGPGESTTIVKPPTVQERIVPKETTVAKPVAIPSVVEGLVTSPMPGTITSIKVKAGDRVNAGDVLLVLECMKILNDIVAPKEGIVKEVFVTEGSYVSTEERLVLIG